MRNNRRPQWKPAFLLSGLLAAVLLTASWLWPPTRSFWDSMDRSVFTYLNGSIAGNSHQQIFWAITNWRPFDLVGGLAILLIALFWLKRDGGVENFSYNTSELFLFTIFLITFNVTLQMLFEIIDYSRLSPTKVIENTVRLSQQVPWIETKDSSVDSFPGDHAYVLLSITALFTIRAGVRTGIVAASLFSPFNLPRLVSGAHWATDVLIGSVAMSLFVISLWFATPLGALLTRRVSKKVFPIFQHFVKHFQKSSDGGNHVDQ